MICVFLFAYCMFFCLLFSNQTFFNFVFVFGGKIFVFYELCEYEQFPQKPNSPGTAHVWITSVWYTFWESCPRWMPFLIWFCLRFPSDILFMYLTNLIGMNWTEWMESMDFSSFSFFFSSLKLIDIAEMFYSVTLCLSVSKFVVLRQKRMLW